MGFGTGTCCARVALGATLGGNLTVIRMRRFTCGALIDVFTLRFMGLITVICEGTERVF